jgi:hypothetical protein
MSRGTAVRSHWAIKPAVPLVSLNINLQACNGSTKKGMSASVPAD